MSSVTTTTTFEKELIHVGEFATQFTVDEAIIRHWAETGTMMLSDGHGIPVPIEHTIDPERNRGTVIAFRVGRNSSGILALFGKIKFRDAEAAKLALSAQVSIFSPPECRGYLRPITHVALTDYPVIPGLDAFQALAASRFLSSTSPVVRDAEKRAAAAHHQRRRI